MKYKLIWYVPETHLEYTKSSAFDAGAGEWSGYKKVCWQVKGLGQFLPLANSNPHIGKKGELSEIAEWRVEIICPENKIDRVIKSLLKSHPYEKPAIEYWPILLPE
ncbi:MAG: NGG1p interacting factor NIF3 [Gammaproteobacteria bacterium]|nr:NGG1p interacting factor NIF3 [Gammaproteobacteria bacterium]